MSMGRQLAVAIEGDDIAIPPDTAGLTGPPLRLDVRCDTCGHEWTELVEQAFMDPRTAGRNKDASWDGILLSKVVACPDCGAEDRYTLTGNSHRVLTVENLKALAGAEGTRVTLCGAETWDGVQVRRASHAIARLKRRTEREPDNGEAWRRLGNFLERFGPLGEAIGAWRRAIAVDENEVEAAFSLAQAAAAALEWSDFEHALDVLLRRLARTNGRRRALLATGAAGLLDDARGCCARPRALEAVWSAGETSSRTRVVKVSSVALDAVQNWRTLADFLAADALISARLTAELPEDSPTLLERELGGASYPSPVRASCSRSKRKVKRKRKLARASRKRNR